MIGITSYGGYIPKLRLDRMSIYQQMGWFAPATVMVAQGERSCCNYDEDSITMAVAAARDCLAGMDKSKLNALYLCSTTLPFTDRQNASIVKSALNLPDAIETCDITSTLKAGTSAMLTALAALKGDPQKQVLVTAADRRETQSSSFYEMWFGDGAAAVTLGSEKVIAEFLGGHSISHDFVDHYRGEGKRFNYTWEERWVRDEGYSKFVPEVVGGLFKKLGISINDVDKVVYPCFFKAEHKKIAKRLEIPSEKVVDTLHEACGETGAAHPLVMLVTALEQAEPGQRILVVGFGQGCDALYFKVTDEIKKLPEKAGIKGCLESKKELTSYTKFLQFRELIETEKGIRAEETAQTSLTMLWRKHKMVLGLVGGKCTKCKTPQYPRQEICVNPECKAVHSLEDYEFADRPARVMTYTADYLAFSVDPPAKYGMIQFEDGGRFLVDFTDCELEDIFVGQPVSLTFRKRYADKDRGFTGYFWKAVPYGEKPEPEIEKEIFYEGKVAIVTGAGGGLGRAYALELARRGAKVVVNDLGGSVDGSGEGAQRPADAVVSEIKELGGEAVASYDSVSTVEGGQAIVDKAVEAFGRVDILINNAGILRDRSLVKMDPKDWEQVLTVHLHGAFNVTKPAMLKMREGGYGRIIVTTSAAGLFGNFGQTNYSAAKLGVVGLMNTLKLEGEKYNIKVNAVAPIAGTRMTEGVLPPDLFEKLKPEFVVPLVMYLCWEGCEETGMVFNAGMGAFSRSAVVSGRGVRVGDGEQVPTPEEIRDKWEAIDDLSGAQPFRDAITNLGAMFEAVSKGE